MSLRVIFKVFPIASMLFFVSCKAKSEQMPGGYSTVQVDSTVQAAANFAVEEQNRKTTGSITLEKVVSAQQQVVAGMNYKMTISVVDNQATKNVETIVYRKLDNSYELTEWSEK